MHGVHGSGSYTGPKSATLGITLTGCANVATKATCASSGAGAGEIAATGLQASLGFIKDESTPSELLLSVGRDLSNSPRS